MLIASLVCGARTPARLEAGADAKPAPSTDLIELGRRLFHDPAASATGRTACASCHDPEHGFSDPAAFSLDETGFTPRHSQPLTDLDLTQPMHWDGSVARLEDAVAARVLPAPARGSGGGSSRGGMVRRRGTSGPYYTKDVRVLRVQSAESRKTLLPEGRPTSDRDLGPNFVEVPPELEQGSVTWRLQRSQRYRQAHPLLGDEQGNPPEDLVAKAIVAYVASLKSEPSAIDRVVAGEPLVLSAAAERGLSLFRGRARCASCHTLKGESGRVLLRDREFHNTGVSWLSEKRRPAEGEPVPLTDPPHKIQALLLARDLTSVREPFLTPDRLKESFEALRPAPGGDPGQGKRLFKTPSLRDVALRPPYMHDGSIGTLAEVVRHYAEGCGDDPERDPGLRPFRADEQDVADLVAFLESLTSPQRPGLPQLPWRERAERVRLEVLDALGKPLAGLDLELVSAGEHASRDAGPEVTTRTRTDAQGIALAPFGSRTHLRVRVAGGLRPLGGDLIPDTCTETKLEMPVAGRATFTVLLEDGVEAPAELRVYRASEPVNAAALASSAATAMANGLVILRGLSVVAIDPDPWILRRVALEERWPVGAPPGTPPDLEATYETLIPSTRTEAWVRFPGEAVARPFDLAKPTSLR